MLDFERLVAMLHRPHLCRREGQLDVIAVPGLSRIAQRSHAALRSLSTAEPLCTAAHFSASPQQWAEVLRAAAIADRVSRALAAGYTS